MDVGTGGLLFVSGLTSRVFKDHKTSLLKRIVDSVKIMPVIILLAFIGVITRWLANHPELVTEYGVHWNFFWTICFINIFANFIKRPNYALMNGFLLLAIHQAFLIYGGAKFILLAKREDFISKNKEGIFGLLGYFATYILGIGVSSLLYEREKIETVEFNNNRRVKVIVKGILFVLMFYFLGVFSEAIQPISRRMVNFPYSMFMVVVVLFYALFMYVGDSCLKVRQSNYVINII